MLVISLCFAVYFQVLQFIVVSLPVGHVRVVISEITYRNRLTSARHDGMLLFSCELFFVEMMK